MTLDEAVAAALASDASVTMYNERGELCGMFNPNADPNLAEAQRQFPVPGRTFGTSDVSPGDGLAMQVMPPDAKA